MYTNWIYVPVTQFLDCSENFVCKAVSNSKIVIVMENVTCQNTDLLNINMIPSCPCVASYQMIIIGGHCKPIKVAECPKIAYSRHFNKMDFLIDCQLQIWSSYTITCKIKTVTYLRFPHIHDTSYRWLALVSAHYRQKIWLITK